MIVACSAEPENVPIESSSGINFPKSDLDTSPSNSNPDSTDIDGSVINKKSDDAHSGIPDVPILPNLKPGWLWDTDGPIILSTKADTNLDDSLFIGSKTFADIVVFNGSLIQVESGFNVDILFDNQKVYEIQFAGPTPGAAFRRSIDAMTDVIASLDVTSGEHIVKMHIDPENLIDEFDENDNVFEKTFIWSDHQVGVKSSVSYSNDELKIVLSKVPQLLKSNRPALAEGGSLDIDEILDIADAGIFLLTGSSIREKRIRIQILDREHYLNRLDTTFRDMFALNDGSDYLDFSNERDFQKKYSLGKKDRIEGMVDVMVDGFNTFDLVIGTLVHELAHAL